MMQKVQDPDKQKVEKGGDYPDKEQNGTKISPIYQNKLVYSKPNF